MKVNEFATHTEEPWCDACEQVHPTTSRAGLDLCAGCADEFDTRVDDGPTEARYRNPPQYYGVEAAPGMEDADPDA